MFSTFHRKLKMAAHPSAPLAEITAHSALRAYWEALRGGSLAPARRDFNPRGIGEALAFAFILEKHPGKNLCVRVRGAHIRNLVTTPATAPSGTPVALAKMPRVNTLLDRLLSQPAAATFCLKWPQRNAAHVSLLPLYDDHNRITRIVGCCTGSAPLKQPLGITSFSEEPLRSDPQPRKLRLVKANPTSLSGLRPPRLRLC